MHPSNGALRRAWVALAVLAASFALLLPTAAPVDASSALQSNGCLGVTGSFSQFAIPITGTATPSPATVSDPIELAGTSVEIAVSSALIGTGVTTGLVTAAPTLADIGTAPGGLAPNGKGVNAVTASPGDISLKIEGTNTSEGAQTAVNVAPVALTFYVVKDATSGVVSVYTDLSSPPSPTTDPARTGTPLAGDLPVLISLGDTTWTPTGGDVEFSEVNTAPANLLTPSIADKDAAPLVLLPKINEFIAVPFHCWPGTVSDAPPGPNPLVPGGSLAFETISVSGGSSTSSTSSTSSSSTTSTSTTSTSTTTSSTTSTSTTTSTTVPSSPTTSTATTSVTATCTNSVTPDESTFTFSVKATAPTEVKAGDSVTLSDQTWTVSVPGTVLDTGLNLGLLTAGQLVDGTMTPAVFASNSAEGTRVADPISIDIGPIEVDAVTGRAKDASTSAPVPDMTWTAVGGEVDYEMATTAFRVSIGVLDVDFTCTPVAASPPIISSAVLGKTDIPPAAPSDPVVLSGTTGGAAPAPAESAAAPELPKTGAELLRLFILGLIVLDIGYLLWSAQRPRRPQVAR